MNSAYQSPFAGSGRGGSSNAGASADPRDMDPYQVLGISRDATPGQIKQTYKRLALQHHPDRIRGDDRAKAEATERFAQIAHAYEMLTRDGNERGQQHRRYQPDAADMAAGVGGVGGGFTQYQQQQQPFVSPFMDMMGGFGGGLFGGFGGMGGAFGSAFGEVPGGSFGGMGAGSSAVPNFSNPFDLFRQMFGSDFAFGPTGTPAPGEGRNGAHVTGNGMPQSFIPMMDATRGGGNFAYSSSTSTSGVGVGSGGIMQSISTTTTIQNGKTVTRTERTTVNPDGSRKTVVDLTGDDMSEQPIPSRLIMDKVGGRGERKPTTAVAASRQRTSPPAHAKRHRAPKRKFGEGTRCLKCCFPTIRKRRRLESGPPARAA
jgi:curved DNA-binding protein CbpA